jgi:tRNA pseudouridine55 synthase
VTAQPGPAAAPGPQAPAGLLIVDKPGGMTSHDVVARVRRLARTRRVGHAGTLDPMATGVLVIGIGQATRLLGHLALTEKEYAATIRLGERTDTDDADGEVLERRPAGAVTEAGLARAAAALTGEILQVPPGVSAIKVRGQRAYRLARAGAPPDLPARPVTVAALDITAIRRHPGPDGPLLDADAVITCSSGTYIRAIARDLGEALGTGGHLTALRRTRAGPYRAADAIPLDALAGPLDALAGPLPVLPLADAAAAAFATRRLSAEEARRIGHGGRLPAAGAGPGPVAALGPGGELVALLTEADGQARPVAVFAGPAG